MRGHMKEIARGSMKEVAKALVDDIIRQVANMSDTERAEKIVEQSTDSHDLISRIVAQIQYEREECAKIADIHEKSEMVKAKTCQRLGNQVHEAGHLFEANAARYIASEIRDRGKGD